MDVTEDPHVVLLEVQEVVHTDLGQVQLVPVDQFPQPHQSEVEGQYQAEYQLEDCPVMMSNSLAGPAEGLHY